MGEPRTHGRLRPWSRRRTETLRVRVWVPKKETGSKPRVQRPPVRRHQEPNSESRSDRLGGRSSDLVLAQVFPRTRWFLRFMMVLPSAFAGTITISHDGFTSSVLPPPPSSFVSSTTLTRHHEVGGTPRVLKPRDSGGSLLYCSCTLPHIRPPGTKPCLLSVTSKASNTPGAPLP